MVGAGVLDQRVTLQRKSISRNGIGEEVVAWAELATVWAQVEPLRGREFFAAAQLQSVADTRIVIRRNADLALTVEDRALWRGQPYGIVSIIDRDARQVDTELMCITGVRDGR